ncbi:hypothetical protein BXZ70DRAFT_70763 [Cristinia sonorae]|uniref:Uncharacterized protein n=1 Tax=Cristinia sonorae TaxID=1940300 RepID=A0A8K0UR76_9AGAR|nr:hypothetical protein BXZ70DRAFT_70763 [Cristinia sonorae]
MEPLKGLHCIAVRSTEIDEVSERGVPFTAPPAESTPCKRAREAQYPSKYLSSGGFASFPAEAHSMAITTLERGTREMKDAWRQMFTLYALRIERRLQIRDARFEELTRPYYDDWNVATTLIKAFWAGTPRDRVRRQLSGKKTPRIEDLGFRMCSITWNEPPILLDCDAVCEGAIFSLEGGPSRVRDVELAPRQSEISADKHSSSVSSTSERRRNGEWSGISDFSKSTGRSGANRNSTRRPEGEIEEEVF